MLRKEYSVTLQKLFFSKDTTENDEQPQLQKSNCDEKHNKYQEEEHLRDESYNEHKKICPNCKEVKSTNLLTKSLK